MKHFTFLKHSPTKESTMFPLWNWDQMPQVIYNRPQIKLVLQKSSHKYMTVFSASHCMYQIHHILCQRVKCCGSSC